ncbi:hypothetical protein HPELS_06085 [Helicobacter pylori ELS37]|uniref:Uncharacterized protein n=1 Tax=Helicobacter pylori ELS37 TaxID=1055527 RepID=A0ABC7ZGX3_HELPX|nr:hypothetical protein HPELS_06085 [Helicobacter pylori ELS37]
MWLGDFLFISSVFDCILKILKTLFVFLPQALKSSALIKC